MTVRRVGLMLLIYAGLLVFTGWRFMETPNGFIPDQDQGALIGVITLAAGLVKPAHRQSDDQGDEHRQ